MIFIKQKEFKLIAPYGLEKLPMYDLPDFIINLKNGKFLNFNDYNSMINELPGFKIIFERINYIKLVETNNYQNFDVSIDNSDVFNLLIFENTKIENQIYSSMRKKNFKPC